MQIAKPKRGAVVHASNFSRKHVVDALQVFTLFNLLPLFFVYFYFSLLEMFVVTRLTKLN